MPDLERMSIDKDFFCRSGVACINATRKLCRMHGCADMQRKWPTPEQFKEEYGVEYSDDSPVWIFLEDGAMWSLKEYDEAVDRRIIMHGRVRKITHIVCACTPYGKPDNDWRPE